MGCGKSQDKNLSSVQPEHISNNNNGHNQSD